MTTLDIIDIHIELPPETTVLAERDEALQQQPRRSPATTIQRLRSPGANTCVIGSQRRAGKNNVLSWQNCSLSTALSYRFHQEGDDVVGTISEIIDAYAKACDV